MVLLILYFNYYLYTNLLKIWHGKKQQIDFPGYLQGIDNSFYDHSEHSRKLAICLCTSPPCQMAWMHTHRPCVPIFPFYCRSLNVVLNEEIWSGD